MTAIIHLEVGDKDFIPTDEQLKAVVAEFLKPMPAFGHKIKVSEVFVGSVHERLFIQAGTVDWQPTREELDDLVLKFLQAEFDPLGGVVATRHGVKLSYSPKLLPKESAE